MRAREKIKAVFLDTGLSDRIKGWVTSPWIKLIEVFAVVIGMIAALLACIQFLNEHDAREKARQTQKHSQEIQKQEAVFRAWQMLNASQPGGKRNALEFLANEGHSIEKIDLSDSNLTGLSINDASIELAKFIRADLAHSSFEDVNLRSADFTGARFLGSRISGTFSDTNFSCADLHSVTLIGDGRNSNFKNARLMGEIKGDFRGANFDGAVLLTTNFSEARLDGAKFSGSIALEGFPISGLGDEMLSQISFFKNDELTALAESKRDICGREYSIRIPLRTEPDDRWYMGPLPQQTE